MERILFKAISDATNTQAVCKGGLGARRKSRNESVQLVEK
jgi:hypothetical protein